MRALFCIEVLSFLNDIMSSIDEVLERCNETFVSALNNLFNLRDRCNWKNNFYLSFSTYIFPFITASLSVSFMHSPYHYLFYAFTLSLSLFYAFTLSLSLFYAVTLSLSLFYAFTLSLSLFYSLTISVSLPLSLILSLFFSLCYSLSINLHPYSPLTLSESYK